MTEAVKKSRDVSAVITCPRCFGDGQDPDVEHTTHCCGMSSECGTKDCIGPEQIRTPFACALCEGFCELPRDTALAYALEG